MTSKSLPGTLLKVLVFSYYLVLLFSALPFLGVIWIHKRILLLTGLRG